MNAYPSGIRKSILACSCHSMARASAALEYGITRATLPAGIRCTEEEAKNLGTVFGVDGKGRAGTNMRSAAATANQPNRRSPAGEVLISLSHDAISRPARR